MKGFDPGDLMEYLQPPDDDDYFDDLEAFSFTTVEEFLEETKDALRIAQQLPIKVWEEFAAKCLQIPRRDGESDDEFFDRLINIMRRRES